MFGKSATPPITTQTVKINAIANVMPFMSYQTYSDGSLLGLNVVGNSSKYIRENFNLD